jgi:hypothetical protein
MNIERGQEEQENSELMNKQKLQRNLLLSGHVPIVLRLLAFWTLSILIFLFKKDVSETGLCLCPQVKAYSVGSLLKRYGLALYIAAN